MYSLAEHQQQCQRSLCLYPVSELLLSCFYRASLWLWQFLWGDHRLEVFAPSSLCVWIRMLWRNLQIKVSPRFFFFFFFFLHEQIVRICEVDWFLRKLFWFFKPWEAAWWMWSKAGEPNVESTARFIWCWMEETPHVNGQNQIVQSGNFCYSSIRLASVDAIKI